MLCRIKVSVASPAGSDGNGAAPGSPSSSEVNCAEQISAVDIDLSKLTKLNRIIVPLPCSKARVFITIIARVGDSHVLKRIEIVQVVALQMEDVIQQSTPEELAPLIEALERARMQQEEATGIREALEAEVRPLCIMHCLNVPWSPCRRTLHPYHNLVWTM